MGSSRSESGHHASLRFDSSQITATFFYMLGHFSALPRFSHTKKPRPVNRNDRAWAFFIFKRIERKKWFSGA
jgi:hypothetical protein